MTQAETFRELAIYFTADVEDIDEEEESMFQVAGTHMAKSDRRAVIALLKDFEAGQISYKEIQSYWDGARFYIVGEDGVRSFLYRARHYLEQSFFWTDIEDLKAGKPAKKIVPQPLSPSENIVLRRLLEYFLELQTLDPDFKLDRKKLLLERLSGEERESIMKLAARIARGYVTEPQLQVLWKRAALSKRFPHKMKMTNFVFSTAFIIESAG